MPTVLVHPRRIEADEMQVFLRAADIAVLPYLRTLNSGVLMLALSFGLPVVVPDEGSLTDIIDPGFARTFNPAVPASLANALAAAAELTTPKARAAALAVAEQNSPATLSLRFATELRAMLFSRTTVIPSQSIEAPAIPR